MSDHIGEGTRLTVKLMLERLAEWWPPEDLHAAQAYAATHLTMD